MHETGPTPVLLGDGHIAIQNSGKIGTYVHKITADADPLHLLVRPPRHRKIRLEIRNHFPSAAGAEPPQDTGGYAARRIQRLGGLHPASLYGLWR